MNDIIDKNSKKSSIKRIDRYQNRVVKESIKYPLDYILVNPDEKKIDRGFVARSSRLKNTIMGVVLKNRIIKNRPKLSDFMRIYAEYKENDPGMSKEQFQAKMRQFYSGVHIDNDQDDEKYQQLAEKFHIIQKEMYNQQEELNDIITDMDQIADAAHKVDDKKKKKDRHETLS